MRANDEGRTPEVFKLPKGSKAKIVILDSPPPVLGWATIEDPGPARIPCPGFCSCFFCLSAAISRQRHEDQ